MAGKGQARGLDVELQVGFRDVWDGDGEVDEVLCGLGLVGALGPEDCEEKALADCLQRKSTATASSARVSRPDLLKARRMQLDELPGRKQLTLRCHSSGHGRLN